MGVRVHGLIPQDTLDEREDDGGREDEGAAVLVLRDEHQAVDARAHAEGALVQLYLDCRRLYFASATAIFILWCDKVSREVSYLAANLVIRPPPLLEIIRQKLERRAVAPLDLNLVRAAAVHDEVVRSLLQQLVWAREGVCFGHEVCLRSARCRRADGGALTEMTCSANRKTVQTGVHFQVGPVFCRRGGVRRELLVVVGEAVLDFGFEEGVKVHWGCESEFGEGDEEAALVVGPCC